MTPGVRCKKMKKTIANIIRGIGSVLSFYLILSIAKALISVFLRLRNPNTELFVVTILWIAPISFFLIAPTIVLSLKWTAPRKARMCFATLNVLGLICSVLSIMWAATLWLIGPINPG